MSEETNVTESNEGGWSTLKKTIIGTLTTVIAGGGMWVSTHLFGGETEQKEPAKTEQAAPVIVNLNNTNTQQQQAGGTTTIVKEKVIEKQAAPAEKKEEKKKSETEDAPW